MHTDGFLVILLSIKFLIFKNYIIKIKPRKVSTTDSEAGLFNKGEHKKVFAYSANVACDANNFILDFVVTPGNTHDSVAFPKLYERLKRDNYNFKYVVVDAGYKILAIAKLIIDDNKIPVMPYKRPMIKNGFFKKYDYITIAIFALIIKCFADEKEKHRMRYTNYRGLSKVRMELTLKFACMNLKKLATWKWKNGDFSIFSLFFEEIKKKSLNF